MPQPKLSLNIFFCGHIKVQERSCNNKKVFFLQNVNSPLKDVLLVASLEPKTCSIQTKCSKHLATTALSPDDTAHIYTYVDIFVY